MNAIRLLTFFVSFTGILFTGNAYAALIMTVDSSAKTLTFGASSATGTPDFGNSIGWQTVTFPVVPDIQELDISSALQLSGATLNGASIDLDGTSGIAQIGLAGDSAFSEVSGTGSSVSYAGLALSLQQSLETYAASSSAFELEAGSGFGDIQVIQVPEPKFYAFAVGLSALCVITLRRRK